MYCPWLSTEVNSQAWARALETQWLTVTRFTLVAVWLGEIELKLTSTVYLSEREGFRVIDLIHESRGAWNGPCGHRSVQHVNSN